MMQHSFTIAISIFASAIGLVAAHGLPSELIIDGTTYQGQKGSVSPFRPVTNQGNPIYDVTSADLTCGASAAQSATQTATANPGDVMQVYWENEEGGLWPHTTGPIQVYFANCGGNCNGFDATSKFFKTSELLKTEEDTNNWVQAALTTGSPVNATVPLELAAGNYIVRFEILALQNAATQGQAEFYPTCFQLNVGGTQTGTPDALISLPGAYSATDPGILVDIYDDISSPYTPPGGPVCNLADPLSNTDDDITDPAAVAGGSAPTPASVAASVPTSSSVPAPTSSSAPATSSTAFASSSSSSSSSSSLSTVPSAAVPAPIINVAPVPSTASSNSSSSASTKQCKRNMRKRNFESDDLVAIKSRGVSAHKKRRLGLY